MSRGMAAIAMSVPGTQHSERKKTIDIDSTYRRNGGEEIRKAPNQGLHTNGVTCEMKKCCQQVLYLQDQQYELPESLASCARDSAPRIA